MIGQYVNKRACLLYLSLLQEILRAILNVFAAYFVQRNGHHFVPTKVQFAQVHQTHAAAILSSVILAFVLDITDTRPLGLAGHDLTFVHAFPYQAFGDIKVVQNPGHLRHTTIHI